MIPRSYRKWLKTTSMAEMSHADSCNFFPPARFQSVAGESDEPAKKERNGRLPDSSRSRANSEHGGDYEIRKVYRIAGDSGSSNGVLASASESGDRSWAGRGWRRSCIWPASLLLRLLWLRSLCLCAVRILRSGLVCWRCVRRRGPMVPRSGMAWALGLGQWMVRSPLVR